jgi:hypothetical protein
MKGKKQQKCPQGNSGDIHQGIYKPSTMLADGFKHCQRGITGSNVEVVY